MSFDGILITSAVKRNIRRYDQIKSRIFFFGVIKTHPISIVKYFQKFKESSRDSHFDFAKFQMTREGHSSSNIP